MNKQERKLKGIYKFKKRIANYRMQGTNSNILRNTGKPCSCAMCSPAKTGEVKPSVTRRLQTLDSKVDDFFMMYENDSHPVNSNRIAFFNS